MYTCIYFKNTSSVYLVWFYCLGSVLPYPDDILAVEIILLFVVGGLESARLFWGEFQYMTL